jgi:hypothetical protein
MAQVFAGCHLLDLDRAGVAATALTMIFRVPEAKMRIVLSVIGILLALAGAVWFLQGINVLPGSFMTGQTRWAIYGALAVIAGAGLLRLANRR